MGELRIRDVDDDLVAMLKAKAKRHGRSLSDEVREMLKEDVLRARRELTANLRDFQNTLHAKYGEMPDSTPLIREERDRRG